jgi:glutamate/tyrosine decarboxylase-like PLP-dependent enzyme
MGFDWIASPACTELEVIVLDWLAKFLNLPIKFHNLQNGPGGSVIQGSAGEAAIVVLLAAIFRKQTQAVGTGVDTSRDNLVVFSSDQTHAIITKACMILGIRHHHQVKTSSANNYAMQAADLRAAIQEEITLGRVPLAVVATTGTTSSCAFDPLVEISEVCRGYGNLWLHVDAAYGGAYACLPELQPLFRGLDGVDSFVVNCHKKLLCSFDLAVLYLADRRPILSALSLQPEYLKNAASESGAVVDYEHWQLPLGRRFRALKLWFVMRRFGTEGMREHVRRGLQHSANFAHLLAQHPDQFELAAPVSLSLVCFRLKGRSEEQMKRFLDSVKATGECFVIHTKLEGRLVVRVACGGTEQSSADVRGAFEVILAEARKI